MATTSGMSVFFSGKGAKFHFLMVQSISSGTKLLPQVHLVRIHIRLLFTKILHVYSLKTTANEFTACMRLSGTPSCFVINSFYCLEQLDDAFVL